MLRPRRSPTRRLIAVTDGSRAAPETASTPAQRNSRDPCLSVVPVVVKDADGFCDGAWGASELPARAVSGGEGGQGRAAGPPGGAALTARSVAASTMSWEARRGFP